LKKEKGRGGALRQDELCDGMFDAWHAEEEGKKDCMAKDKKERERRRRL